MVSGTESTGALQLCSLKVEQSVKKGNAKLIATVMK